jgi:hypothetical protein
LLAGFIDSDGSYSNNRYTITQVRKDLLEDLVELTRSLGFAATFREYFQYINDEPKIYYITNISGENMNESPVLLDRKKAIIQPRKREPLFHKFSVSEETTLPCVYIATTENFLADNCLVI